MILCRANEIYNCSPHLKQGRCASNGHYAGSIPPAVAEGDYSHTGKTTVRKCTLCTSFSWSHSNEVHG